MPGPDPATQLQLILRSSRGEVETRLAALEAAMMALSTQRPDPDVLEAGRSAAHQIVSLGSFPPEESARQLVAAARGAEESLREIRRSGEYDAPSRHHVLCQLAHADLSVRRHLHAALAPAPAPAAVTSSEPSRQPALPIPERTDSPREGERVALLVEDDPIAVAVVTPVLQDLGLRVLVCEDGPAARATLAEARPVDVVLLDVDLPGIDGFAVLRAWRAAGTLPPTIVLTARGAAADVGELLALGAALHLQKPVRPPELRAALRSLLEGET